MHYSAPVLLVILTLSVFTFIPNVTADEWKIYKLTLNNQVFKIPYKITNGDVKKIEIDPEFITMIVSVDSDPVNNGTIEIIVPRELVDDITDHHDLPLRVVVDGDDIKPKEVSKSLCFRTLSIDFHAGSKQIEIGGAVTPEESTTVVPPVYVATDKNTYNVGEIIRVSGCTSFALDDNEVILQVVNPEGRMYKSTSVTPNIDGSFSISFPVEGELTINGTYTAKVTYAGKSATSSFVIPEFPTFVTIIFATGIFIVLTSRLMPKPSRLAT